MKQYKLKEPILTDPDLTEEDKKEIIADYNKWCRLIDHRQHIWHGAQRWEEKHRDDQRWQDFKKKQPYTYEEQCLKYGMWTIESWWHPESPWHDVHSPEEWEEIIEKRKQNAKKIHWPELDK